MAKSLSLMLRGPSMHKQSGWAWSTWGPVLATSFPNLQTLKLDVVWECAPEASREALLRLLGGAEGLEHLTLVTCGPPYFAFPFLPHSLKHLSCFIWPTVLEGSSHNPFLTPPTCPALKLQGLSFCMSDGTTVTDTLGLESVARPFLDCSSLKHLMLGKVFSISGVTTQLNILQTFSTLHCLHFSLRDDDSWAIFSLYPRLDIGALPLLNVLEIGLNGGVYLLRKGDESSIVQQMFGLWVWLSDSISTSTNASEPRLRDPLQVVLLLDHWHSGRQEAPNMWEGNRTFAEEMFPNLSMVNIFAFITDQGYTSYPPGVERRNHEHNQRRGYSPNLYATPTFLGSIPATEPILYSSLWTSCICSGLWS